MPFVPDDTATVDAPPPAPTGRFVPDAAPPPPAPRTGGAALPTEAESKGLPYTPPPAQAPAAPSTAADKITGAVQAGLNLVTSIAGGIVGGISGTARTVYQGAQAGVGAVQRKMQGLPPETMAPRPSLEQNQAEDSQGVSGALKRTVSGPMDLREPQTPDTALGQQYTEATAPVMDAVMAAAPLHGTMGPAGGVKAGAEVVRRMAGASPEAGVASAAVSKAGDAVRQGTTSLLGVDPELAKVARTASSLKYPIDVRPDQVIEGAKYSKFAGEAAASVPLSGSTRASNQTAFTRNLIDMINPEDTKSERLTPDVFNDAMKRSGEGIGEITDRTPVPLDDVAPGLRGIKAGLSKATEDNRNIVNDYINDIHTAASENEGVLDGTRLKELNSQIGTQARANAGNDLGRYLNNLQDVVQDAIERNAAPEDVQPLRDFRRQYAYGKMVEPMVATTIDGVISPSGLMQRVTATKQGKHYMARAMGGPIGELAKVGKMIREPASSGTAERLGVLGALGGGAAIEPHTAAATFVGANAYNRLGPKLVRALVGNEPERRAEEPPAGPPSDPGTTLGAADEDHPPQGGAPASPLGDLTPDWQTSPGAGGASAPGTVDPAGLVPAIGEAHTPFVASGKRAGEQIPAVPGRPGLPDSMLTGRPAEVSPDEATNAAMQEPGAQEAMRRAQIAREDAARTEIPVGEAIEVPPGTGVAAPKTPKPGSIPVGKTTEGQPELKTATPKKIPAGEATEITPEVVELGRKWQRDFGMGEDDVHAAHAVARAFDHDPEAVAAAAHSLDGNPAAFDREIARINNERTAREDATHSAARSSKGDAGGDAQGADAAQAPVSEKGQASEPAGAVRAAGEQPGADSTAAPAAGRGDGDSARGQTSTVIREVPGGFEAYRDGKKVGYLKDNLERGQAKQLGENANVNMVKVDKDVQGTGVGRALYEAFHDKHDGRILPSGKTEPSAWKVWKRNFPNKVDKFVASEAARIKDGADPKLVIGNITDPEVAQRVQEAAAK